jgi:cupin superfamily acireductone dioxygenase involved in methionine salvage
MSTLHVKFMNEHFHFEVELAFMLTVKGIRRKSKAAC